MLGGSNKLLQGLPLSNQLGGLGNMQNPMLLNNLYGVGDQNLSMLMPGIEDLYQLQLQNSNPTQLNSAQLGAGQFSQGQFNHAQLNKALNPNSMPVHIISSLIQCSNHAVIYI